ncbi:MAG: DUF2384 domain-containing protein [Methylocystis sp.]|nr:DUF2384 domain-containing protein [Methylocystis sp.]MBI3275177.1 DUF2384 domain-containing protein [Methylocystis sp.]
MLGLGGGKSPKEIAGASSEAQLGAIEALVLKGETPYIPASSLKGLLRFFAREEIETIVVPKRTLARRIAKQEPLTANETDRALRLARIGAQAERVFGDPEKAKRWLRKTSPALSGQAPIALLKTETGAQAVAELLGQIAHGMFV